MRGVARSLGVFCAALALAPAAAAALPSFVPPGKAFGFNANLVPPDAGGRIKTFDAAQAAGATHLRMVVNWRVYESETSVLLPVPSSFSKPVGQPTGSYRTDAIDKDYLDIVNRGITPVITVDSAPAWASTFHTCQTNVLDQIDTTKCPTDWNKKPIKLYPAKDRFDAYRAFVAALARRYPLAMFEGSNEPDTQKAAWARFHPPISHVSEIQCAYAAAIRSVDPDRTVLTHSVWRLEYLYEYLPPFAGRDCFDAFNLHQYAWLEVRTGPASGARAHLNNVRKLLNEHLGGARIWVTETGMSNTVSETADGSKPLGEPLVATAYPQFVKWWYSQSEVDGVFLHTIREGAFGEGGGSLGFGLLTREYAPKDPGPGVLPRFCWIVLSAGNTYPGCDGRSLPPPPAPAPPSFYWEPHIPFSSDTTVGSTLNLLFFERGEPAPDVFVTWYRCNGVGLGCVAFLTDFSVYKLREEDRFKTIKVVLTLRNAHGSLTTVLPLTPVIK